MKLSVNSCLQCPVRRGWPHAVQRSAIRVLLTDERPISESSRMKRLYIKRRIENTSLKSNV